MGITNLDVLIKSMDPVLSGKTYYFCSFKKPDPALVKKSVGMFIEKEGMTLILEEQDVPKGKGMAVSNPHAFITLNVNSDLQAVGFLAALAPHLAEAGISINVVSAFYHDHLFVPKERGPEALEILKDLSARASKSG